MPPVNKAPEPGPIILALRHARGLSLSDLAKLAGVSKAMLSQVEQGKANPTVATLWKIAGGLGVDVQRLLGVERTAPALTVKRRGEAAALVSSDGLVNITLLSPASHVDRSELYRLSLQKGGTLESKPHAPGTEEVLTVISGELRCESGAEKSLLGPGDSAHYPADVPHVIRQHGAKAAEAILVVVFPSLTG